MDNIIRRDKSFPFCGRLIALPTGPSLQSGSSINLDNQLSIDFPGMPDSIDLARAAEYSVTNAPSYADGIHQFMATRPLEIPFSFRLHSFDKEYCKRGALTLIELAARLHSFVIPIDTGEQSIPAKAGTTNSNTDADIDKKAASPDGGENTVASTPTRITPPVTCRLELIFIGDEEPGIVCTGYVREVSVKLNGPWLKGPGQSRNLPSSGDFSFIFVHHPGHGNKFAVDGDLFAQAYANIVKDKFYNTRQLSKSSSYQGLIDPPPVFETTDSPPATGELFRSTDSPPAIRARIIRGENSIR